jgi:hypothetical protein
MVKGIFIPIAANDLFFSETSKAVYLDLVAFEMKVQGKNGETHIVKQSLSKEKREKMTKEEQNAMPILGNIKAEAGGGGYTETINNPAPDEIWGEDASDDKPLPF